MALNFNEVVDAEFLPDDNLPAVAHLSLDTAKPTFQEFLAVVDEKTRQAKAIIVTDQEGYKDAVSLVGEAKRYIKDIDAKKKALDTYREAKSFLDGLNQFCKELSERFEKIVGLVDPKVKSYTAMIELERRKQQEAARRAEEELREKIRKETEEANRKIREEAEARARVEAERLRLEAEEKAKKAKSEAEAKALIEKAAAEAEEQKKKVEAEIQAREIQAPVVVQQVIPKNDTVTRTEEGVSMSTARPWKFEVEDADLVPRNLCIPDKTKIRDAVKMGIREIPGVRIFQDIQTKYRS